MTTLEAPAPATDQAALPSPSRAAVLGGVALVVAAVGALVVERGDAGLAGWTSVIGILSLVPLAFLGRAWRLPWWLLTGAAALPVSVLVVAATGELGAQGAARAATYGYGAFAFVAVASWATSATRRLALSFVLGLVVLDQYTQAWLPWWGSGQAGKVMVGTFYWHNQFAAFCLGGVALMLLVALTGRRLLGVGAGVVVAFATAGCIDSGSRASMLALAGVWLVGLLAALRLDLRTGALRWLALAAGSFAVTTLMTSPLLFPRTGSWIPGGALTQRLPGVMHDKSTTDRLSFWQSGLHVGAERPITGHGLQTYGLYMGRYLPHGAGWSSNPHNEWVLGWAEGGIVGLLPLLAVLAGALVVVAASLRRLPAPAELARDAGRWGALIAVCALLAHAGVDFDWEYPALVGLAGVAGALAVAPLLERRPAARSSVPVVRAATGVGLVALLLVAALVGRAVDPRPGKPSMGYDATQIAHAQAAHPA